MTRSQSPIAMSMKGIAYFVTLVIVSHVAFIYAVYAFHRTSIHTYSESHPNINAPPSRSDHVQHTSGTTIPPSSPSPSPHSK